MKIVFDTNVYIAATKSGSYAWEQLKRSRPNGPYELFISNDIILEIRDTLENKFHWDRRATANYIEAILMYATLVHPKEKITNVLEDKDDHIILECAVEAKAIVIISADKGLLRLKDYRGISIVHPTMLQYIL